MESREEIERQIREWIAADVDALTYSNKLFQQDRGLFGRLVSTEAERRALVQTELFRSAQARLRELEVLELERFREVIKQVDEKHLPGSYRVRLESADQPI